MVIEETVRMTSSQKPEVKAEHLAGGRVYSDCYTPVFASAVLCFAICKSKLGIIKQMFPVGSRRDRFSTLCYLTFVSITLKKTYNHH